jgi:hypothetical protein
LFRVIRVELAAKVSMIAKSIPSFLNVPVGRVKDNLAEERG